jgi:transposase
MINYRLNSDLSKRKFSISQKIEISKYIKNNDISIRSFFKAHKLNLSTVATWITKSQKLDETGLNSFYDIRGRKKYIDEIENAVIVDWVNNERSKGETPINCEIEEKIITVMDESQL